MAKKTEDQQPEPQNFPTEVAPEPPKTHETYATLTSEVQPFPIFIGADVEAIRGFQDERTRIVSWHVPLELVERFERHSFVAMGRIVRKDAT